MKNNFSELKISEKLQKYLDEIEKETGQEIFIDKEFSFALNGPGRFESRVEDKIQIILHFPNFNDCSEDFKQTFIAHEASHGLCRHKFGNFLNRNEFKKCVNKNIFLGVINFIEDSIIEKRTIKEEGFSVDYDLLSENSEGMKEGLLKNYNEVFNPDVIIKYMFAWSCYMSANGKEKNIAENFMKFIKDNFKKEYEYCEKIVKIMEKYNIETKDDYDKVLSEIMNLLRLKVLLF